ncbi:hypothetical protein, partial [Oleiphilus sp. HI0086]
SKIAGIDIDEYEDYEIARDLMGIYQSNESKTQNESVIFLDFDGVIVDSAKEAYAMAMLATKKSQKLSDVDLNSEHCRRFLEQRCHIGPAWNYYYLLKCLDEEKDVQFLDMLPNEAGDEARVFQDRFFATRQVVRNHFWDEWLDLNHFYEGANGFIDLINNNSNVVVVTTKDAETVSALLEKYGVLRDVEIFDSRSYDQFGCKSLFMDDYIK